MEEELSSVRRVGAIILITLMTLVGPAFANSPERVVLLYMDGLHPEAIDRFEMKALQEIRDAGVYAEKGVMGFPAHPTILPYGEWHYTSVPNVMTMAGTAFLKERPTYLQHQFSGRGKTVHAAGSSSYRSLTIGYDYAMTTAGVTDRQVIDFYINAFESEGDIVFARIMLQEAGNAGRKLSGKNQSDDPWAQNVFHPDSPYGAALKVADGEVARLRAFLQDKGKLDSTLFVIMGDGQSLHGWHQIYDENADLTPIIFSGPGVSSGKSIPYAENIDVAPTIAALMNVSPPSADGGAGRVLSSMLKGGRKLRHPRQLERINAQIREYAVLHAQAVLKAFDDPKMNMLLMEIEHGLLSEHQFFTVERLMEWDEARDLDGMIEANDWVLETLRLALNDGVYRFSDY